MNIPNKRELQQLEINHSLAINFNNEKAEGSI